MCMGFYGATAQRRPLSEWWSFLSLSFVIVLSSLLHVWNLMLPHWPLGVFADHLLHCEPREWPEEGGRPRVSRPRAESRTPETTSRAEHFEAALQDIAGAFQWRPTRYVSSPLIMFIDYAIQFDVFSVAFRGASPRCSERDLRRNHWGASSICFFLFILTVLVYLRRTEVSVGREADGRMWTFPSYRWSNVANGRTSRSSTSIIQTHLPLMLSGAPAVAAGVPQEPGVHCKMVRLYAAADRLWRAGRRHDHSIAALESKASRETYRRIGNRDVRFVSSQKSWISLPRLPFRPLHLETGRHSCHARAHLQECSQRGKFRYPHRDEVSLLHGWWQW